MSIVRNSEFTENELCFSLPEVGDGKLEDSGSGLHLNFGHYLLKSANELKRILPVNGSSGPFGRLK